MAKAQTIEVPIAGMDCANCARHVHESIAAVPGVFAVNVLLSAEKAIIQADPAHLDKDAIRRAIEAAGYCIPTLKPATEQPGPASFRAVQRRVMLLFGMVVGAVLLIVVAGEWLGLFETVTAAVPWWTGLLLVLLAGYPVFIQVVRAALRGKVTSHTLMSVGVIAALVIGQWVTATIVVFFMRVGDYAEQFTSSRARRAVKDLTSLAPQTARVLRDGTEIEVPVGTVQVGEIVVVRPGEQIPVDGQVIAGHATVNQATITGESLPVEAGVGATVFAATIVSLGSLRIRTMQVGADTTFGHVIKLVEEAETHRADVQRVADVFATWYLPVVVTIAALTLLLRQDPLAMTAVLVVACSCSFALATPIAMLASIGASAKQGLLVKGGKYLEVLARADVLLVDKTGTLTLGRPQITDVRTLNGVSESEMLVLAASAEHYSEHPLAQAVCAVAQERGLVIADPEEFDALPGMGVQSQINGQQVTVGNRRLLPAGILPEVDDLEQQGKTLLFVLRDNLPIGVLAAADTVRSEVPRALAAARELGIKRIELLTGDNERTAANLAAHLGVEYRANLLPEDKIAVVKDYQAQGHIVVMVGDGVNDAPALAQADVGIAMGAAGSDIAIESAHVALMREDWSLVPEVLHIARRTMGVVKFNIGFTAVYNLVGLTLAAFGILPPVLAAAAQSLPDLGILANSSRLLRVGKKQR